MLALWGAERSAAGAEELDPAGGFAVADRLGQEVAQLRDLVGVERADERLVAEQARAQAVDELRARVTGLDFSPAAIDAARDLAARAGLTDRADFVCADVHDATEALGGATFDIVYVSLGALCWLPSVDRWASQVGALVAPGGRLYLHDAHPVSWALADDELRLQHTYFEESEAFTIETDVTYTDATRPLRATRLYEWNHGIGEIVTALLRHGLRLDWLVEHDWTVWPRYPWLLEDEHGQWSPPPGVPRAPLSYTLLATRPR